MSDFVDLKLAETALRRLVRGLAVEEDAQFTNVRGNAELFADFAGRTVAQIAVALDALQPTELIEQTYHYASCDLPSRMLIVQKLSEYAAKMNELLEVAKQTTEPQNRGLVVSQDLDLVELSHVVQSDKKLCNLLARLNLRTVDDLLRYWPRTHLDFAKRKTINQIQAGETVTIIGVIQQVKSFESPRKGNLGILNLLVGDGTGTVTVTRYVSGRSGNFLLQRFKRDHPVGAMVMVSGTVSFGRQTRYQFANAAVEVFAESGQINSLNVGRIVPVYATTEGLSQLRLRNLIHRILCSYRHKETLPQDVLLANNLMDLPEAVHQMHFPDDAESLRCARRRVMFEELLLIQLPLVQRRYKIAQKYGCNSAPKIALEVSGPYHRFLKQLPYSLTSAQRRVCEQILTDMESPIPMVRLVQGDVGCGKTIVAMLAMLAAVENKGQAALMVPTEVLAEQHFEKYCSELAGLGLKMGLLTGSISAADRRETLVGLANGQIDIVVGTHALIQDDVQFANLTLAIVDEQHRFGIRQRESLINKSNEAARLDVLFLTATPIPRTLALFVYGGMDVSLIDELPPGRMPIQTRIVPRSQSRSVHAFVRSELQAGRQAYIIFPLIEESETLMAKSVAAEADKLRKVYADFAVEIVHGKLSNQDKEEAMRSFRENRAQVLIGTTVVEVGVDVPNATVMIVENAERFGLAQLHQLRGRVGRGMFQSHCILFTERSSPETYSRLKILEETEDGFEIARRDMELRGAGELLGIRQSGVSDFALNALIEFPDLLDAVQKTANKIIESDPQLVELPPVLLRRIIKAMESSTSLQGG